MVSRILIFTAIAVVLVMGASKASGSYGGDSPIQILAIKSPAGARLLSARGARGPRTNGNPSNNNKSVSINKIENGKDEIARPITVIQHRQVPPPTPQLTEQPTKQQPKPIQKQQNTLNNTHKRAARLHVAPGAYPVYYAIARANGLFNGQNIWSFKSMQSAR